MALPKNGHIVEVSEATKRRYFKNLTEQLHSLRQAMEKTDFESIREICHRVRGSASLFGLRDLGEACRSMEEAAIEKKENEIVDGFQVIEVIISRNAAPSEG